MPSCIAWPAQKLRKYRAEAKRRGYLLTAESPIFISYRQQGKIKPMSQASMEQMFANASLAAWHDLELKRFSPKDLRDYVQSALENAGVNRNIISPMLAHKVKGVDKHYSEHDIKDFLEKFKKAQPYLLPLTVEKLKAEQVEMSSEIAKKLQEVEILKQDFGKMLSLMKLLGDSDKSRKDIMKNIMKTWFKTENPDEALEISGDKERRILQIDINEDQARFLDEDLGRTHLKFSEDVARETGFKEIIIRKKGFIKKNFS